MTPGSEAYPYRSIFSSSSSHEQEQNFDDYWRFCRAQDGELLEAEQSLSRKKATLLALQACPVRLRQPLPAPEAFYRNYVQSQDPLATLDRKTLLLMAIYKVARHEWVGISGAWEVTPPFSTDQHVITKICRYHLAEEFCHVRLFHEMFVTCHLDRVVWVPLSPGMQRVYRLFARLPGRMMDPPAFVSELMGLMFYRAVDALLNDVFGDEPEACQRLRTLLHEITIDELSHVGQRRNFLSPRGVQIARWMVRPMFRAFFRGIPESRYLFDVKKMIANALAFDYNDMAPELLQRSWVPTYCQGGTDGAPTRLAG
jgi:hypothetical protein